MSEENGLSLGVTLDKETNVLILWVWSHKHNDWLELSRTTVESGTVADKTPSELYEAHKDIDSDIGESDNKQQETFPYDYILIREYDVATAGPNEDWNWDNSDSNLNKTIKNIFGATEYDVI